MASNLPIQPLQGQFKIADPETGLPTQEFLLYMKAMYDLLPSQEEAIAAIEGAGLTPLSEKITLGENNRFGSEIEIDANTQAILNEISTTWGSILYRGENEWASLAPGTAGQFLRTGGAGADPTWAAGGGGGGGGAWAEIDSWTFSSPVPHVDFTGLGSYSDLLLIGRGISGSSSVFRGILASVDGGSTFYNTSGDYVTVSAAGAESAAVQFDGISSASSAARSFWLWIAGSNVAGPPKMATGSIGIERLFVASPDPIDALRYYHASGNITGGSISLLGR